MVYSDGKPMKVGNASTEEVALHVCETVLPFLEELQDLCDAMEVRVQWMPPGYASAHPSCLAAGDILHRSGEE